MRSGISEFDPEEYFSNRFGRYVGKPGVVHNVAIRFTKSAVPWMLERRWHPKQKVKKHRDGGITLSFPAPALYEVKRWVLSWGAEAEVLRPKELRDEVVSEARGLVRSHGGRR